MREPKKLRPGNKKAPINAKVRMNLFCNLPATLSVWLFGAPVFLIHFCLLLQKFSILLDIIFQIVEAITFLYKSLKICQAVKYQHSMFYGTSDVFL